MKYNNKNIDFAKDMRKNMTKEEAIIWYYLRAKRFHGLKFKRQVLIGDYIVDFLCKEKMLIIELDGGHHNQTETIIYDSVRTDYLNSEGYKVLRYWNNDIMNNIDNVLEDIYRVALS